VIYNYLIETCDFHPSTAEMYGVAVDAHTEFFSSIAYPGVAELGLRVNKLGKSSVTYEVGIFEQGVDEVKAVASWSHRPRPPERQRRRHSITSPVEL
jgi:acyl-CoA thioester hydrolase